MVAVLVADDPRRSADRMLGRLVQIHRAHGGAILCPRDRQADVWLSAGLSLTALAELPVRWADHARSLAAGRSVVEPAFALLPAMLGDQMVAAIYLAQPQGAPLGDTRVFGTAIAQAVRAADESAAARPSRSCGRPTRPGSSCSPCWSGTTGTSPRWPTAGRHPAHGLHAPRQLRNRAQACAEAVQEAAGPRMSGIELAVAHAVKIALVVLAHRHALARTHAGVLGVRSPYVIAVLAGNTLVTLWPSRF